MDRDTFRRLALLRLAEAKALLESGAEMDSKALVGNKIEDGRRLVEALDRSGLSPKAAFWYYDWDGEAWQLAISLPIVDKIGDLKVYQRILSAIKKLEPPLAMPISDIDLYGSRSTLLKVVKAAVRPKKAAGETFQNFLTQVDYRSIQDAYIYRIQ